MLKWAEEISKTNTMFYESPVRLLLTMQFIRHSQYPLKVMNNCSVAVHIV